MLRHFTHCCVLSHRIVRATSSSQVLLVRTIRTRTGKNGEKHSDEKTTDDSKDFGKSGDDKKQFNPFEQMPPQFKKLTPEQVRKLKILGFSTFFGTTIITFVLGMVIFSGDFLFSVPETGAISFDDFVHKYLPTGEVKRIVFHANKQRAIAYLHDGAIIEGRPHPEPVFIRYDRAVSGQPDQFTMDIRRIEEKQLKIGPQDAIHIDTVYGATTRRIVEFMIGTTILIFLLLQYSRVFARRIIEQKTKEGGSSGRPFQK